MDNGKQFNCATFRDFSTQLGTTLCLASVYHPQSNGAVERANGIIFTCIKKNITELPKGKWVDELPRVVWSHNTTVSRTTKFTPFKHLYGKEAVTPEEIKLKSWRTTEGAKEIEEDMKPSVNTIEVGKMQAAIKLGRYQEETRRWRNKKVKQKGFREIKEGDLVLWRDKRRWRNQRDKRRGPSASENSEGQAKGQDVQQVGRPIPRHIHGKAGGLQASHTRRNRRPILLEQRHATEVFHVGFL